MRFTRPQGRRVAPFAMTPMVDVVLLLLIFFMFTSQFSQITRTPLDLPKEPGEGVEIDDSAAIVLDLDKNGQIFVAAQPVDMDRLVRMVEVEIERRGGDVGLVDVLIRADRNAPAEHLNTIARRLRALGIGSWKLGTADPGATP